MFGGSVGSFHSDVLNANPDTAEQKKQLVEELKRRAKGNFPIIPVINDE